MKPFSIIGNQGEVPNEYTVADIMMHQFDIRYETEWVENEKVAIDFGIDFQLEFDIDGRETWSNFANRLADTLEINADNLILKIPYDHTENIKLDRPCQDIIKKTKNLWTEYKPGAYQFRNMEMQGEDVLVNLKVEYGQIIKKCYIPRQAKLKTTIAILQWIGFSPLNFNGCTFNSLKKRRHLAGLTTSI